MTSIEPKNILLTGASSGIGKELAMIAALQGHTLILLLRPGRKSEAALEQIGRKAKAATLVPVYCNLALQSSLLEAIARIKHQFSVIDIMVNNAAVFSGKKQFTIEGTELTIAVNVMAPFILMTELISLMTRPGATILNICSIGERFATIPPDDWFSTVNYSGNAMYNRSKRMLIMLGYEFAQKYQQPPSINSMHPGPTKSGLIKNHDVSLMPLLLRMAFKVMKHFRRSAHRSASDIYALITSPEYAGLTGKFFSGTKLASSSTRSQEPELMHKMYRRCLLQYKSASI